MIASLPSEDVPQPTDEEILALAHRTATTYAHRSDPKYHSYAFVPHTMLDFSRKLLALRPSHGETPAQDAFCDSHCCWSGHHKDCVRYDPPSGVRVNAEPVAEMIACERTGISVREIDGRWKFLRPGDKLCALASA